MLEMIDLLGNAGHDLRSSIVLTYSLDLPLYDGLIRGVLNRSGIWNQMTFCDFSPYLQDPNSHMQARHAGRHYSVTPILQQGAFHPKVYMLLGPRQGRLLIGSGNATIGGLLRNAEVFGLFDFDADKQSPPHVAFATVFGLVESLAANGSDMVRKQIKSARQMASWLNKPGAEDGRKVLVGGQGRTDLFSQIKSCLPTGKSDSLFICSSSFDRKLSGMKRLASLSKSKPICIVQPQYAEIDGAAVKKLNSIIEWRPFIDPYPKEKRKRKDVRAHAKIFVFGHGKTETCVFGSANASTPALNSTNTEVVVVRPKHPRGEIAQRLGLNDSLKAKSIEKDLTSRKWESGQDERPESRFPFLLSAVAAVESEYRLSFASTNPPVGACLALSDRNQGVPSTIRPIRRKGESLASDWNKADEATRFAWICSKAGTALSNPVATTWPTVAAPRKASTGSAMVAKSLGMIQDGTVLGTVLFELLDQFRDFEVIHARSSGTRAIRKNGDSGDNEATEKSSGFFYTDSKGASISEHHWAGDRIDLDILASLVQPLAPVGRGQDADDDDDTYDDSQLAEEAEGRQIIAQKGKATGTERKLVEHTPSEKLAKAVSKLEHRLSRAGKSIEDSLEYLAKFETLPLNSVARQIWMTHIGAFLAGRVTESSEGEEFVCLEPWLFANYVLRVCRAFAGSKKIGGFLDRVPPTSWEGLDGEALAKGLAFLWTCVTWATAYMIDFYTNGKGKSSKPESIAVSSAELVAARFIYKVSEHCTQPDQVRITERFPAWCTVSSYAIENTRLRLKEICRAIADVEVMGNLGTLGPESMTKQLKAGSLVHNPNLGVTMMALDGTYCPYHLVDMSKPSDEPVKYKMLVSPVLFKGRTLELFQRTDGGRAAVS
ncbi:MAG: hypothetical protein ACLPY1_15185 [Terracidiphilus sp.]